MYTLKTDVYIAFFGHCFKFCVSNGKLIKEDVTGLVFSHEEADTLICMHVNHINSTKAQNIIRASDTEIAVVLIYHSRKFDASIWMDIRTSYRNDRRYVNSNKISTWKSFV